jgi:hypothetical protein
MILNPFHLIKFALPEKDFATYFYRMQKTFASPSVHGARSHTQLLGCFGLRYKVLSFFLLGYLRDIFINQVNTELM